MKLKISALIFVASFIVSLQACQPKEYKNVFVDGTFDLAHYGHQQVIQNAIKTGSEHFNVPPEQIRVIAGVAGPDSVIIAYKRRSVYSHEEKMKQISGFKGVHKVVPSEMVTKEEFIKKHNIDLVVAGGDYAIGKGKAQKYYADPIRMGIYKTFPRTEGVSTSDILRRTVDRVAEFIENKIPETNTADREVINKFLELVKKYF